MTRATKGGKTMAVIQETSSRDLTRVVTMDITIVKQK